MWLVNRFGDVFAVFEDGSVHMLDVGTGVMQRLADSRDDFAARIDAGNNANHWLMIPLVDQCVAAGLTLSDGQCYGYKIPPILGGKYAARAVILRRMTLLADICRQTKDLPDGTRIRAVVIDGG